MNKIINVWKPIGWTSFDVVKKIKSYVRPSKVGHAGTLDPFAEGVLLICIGKKTKQVEMLMNNFKEYFGTIKLGEETDTLDCEGTVVKKSAINKLSESKILKILNTYIGDIEQIPPMYSALKVNGKRLYEYARKGQMIKRNPRVIRIYELELINFTNDTIDIRVKCGRGTYIRVLASDIARSLNTVGYLKSLVRSRIGDYNGDDSVYINDIDKWLSTKN